MTFGNATADVVIIGGGVRGASIAHSLAKAGVDVLLVEKGSFASEASGANMGLINVSRKRPAHYAAISLLSADMYPELVAELGEDVGYERKGNLDLVEREEELGAAAAHIAEQRQIPGLHLELVTGAEVRKLEPALSPAVCGVIYCPQDGSVIPMTLTRALGKSAKRFGARLWLHAEVVGIKTAGDKLREVITTQGTISTEVVVNAAGIYVPAIARMVGIEVSLRPQRGQMYTTEPLPPILQHPVLAFRQLPTGNFLIGTTNEYVGVNRGVTLNHITDILRRTAAIIPALKGAQIIRCWAGLRPMPEDGLPIYGEAPDLRGFYIATGHSGVTLAPLTGRVFCDLIVKGRTEIPMGEYSLSRKAHEIKDEWASRKFKVR